jgi:hypothetical protein
VSSYFTHLFSHGELARTKERKLISPAQKPGAGRPEWSSLQGLQAKMLKSTGKRRKRNLSESQRLSMIDSDDDV